MPRRPRDERIETRTARLKLAARAEPYFRAMQEGFALGYRRIAGKGGSWIARRHTPERGRQFRALGQADDMLEADGLVILTYAQAQDAARLWFAELARDHVAGVEVERGYSVKDALDDYVRAYRIGGGRDPGRVETSAKAHILPALGAVALRRLTRRQVQDWMIALAEAPPRLRAGRNQPTKHRAVDPTDTDAARRRRATANRVLTTLKAALNHAWRQGRVAGPEAWAAVTPFRRADAPRIRWLEDAECLRLVNASPEDFRQLVVAALLTGGRYGELVALQAGDFSPTARAVRFADGKTAKPRMVALPEEGVRFFTQAAAGKDNRAPLFTRADGERWGKSHQARPMLEASKAARIAPAVSFHILRHTYASRLARRGLPMAVIAEQLGHADLRMTSRHYAHLAPGHVASTIEAGFGELGLMPAAPQIIAFSA